MTKVDVLAVGAHPDDIELTVGGTVLLAKKLGLSVAICHLTQGEMGTRGSPEQRREEAQAAATALNVDDWCIAGLPDGGVTVDEASKKVIVETIRHYQPSTILAPYPRDLHPDHEATGQLVRQAFFLSGLQKWDTGQAPWRPQGILYYMSHTTFEPTLIVDISAHFDQKKKAAQCYQSQFFATDSKERETYISNQNFWAWWEGRARHYGNFVGAAFGEPLWVDGPLPSANPFEIFRGFGKYRN